MAEQESQVRAGDTSQAIRPGTLTALLREIARAPGEVEGTAWDEALQPGASVGRFELIRELGRGGFGVVWEAKDRELGRKVAFKAVRAGGHSAVREERLLREAEAAAQLSHPNIVTLFDVGRAEAGPYLILELLQGETLKERLARGPVPVREAVRIGVEVAQGMAHAHAQGVIHRDLKPANVFLCEGGQVKVLDFGLAHAFGQRWAEGGTSGYMAPEQREGAPEDERTDVWALGVLLFELLTGTNPFPRGKAARAPELEVPGLPALGPLVKAMLAPHPVERPRDGGEALEALLPLLGELERAPVAPGAVRARRRPRLRRLGLVVAGVALGAAIGVGAGWWTRVRQALPLPAEPVTLAVLPLANLSGDAAQDYFSDGMTVEIIGKLSRLGGLSVVPRGSVARYRGTDKNPQQIGKELKVAYLLEGSIRRAGERIRVDATLVKADDAAHVWTESLEARLDDVFEVQERLASRIVESLQVRLSPEEATSLKRWGTRNAAAYDEYLRGKALAERMSVRENLEAASRHFERALQMDPDFAPAMTGLAFVEGSTYRNFDSSPERLVRARGLLDRALALDPKLSSAIVISGLLRATAWDYRGAAEDLRRAVALDPRDFGAWDFLCWALGYVTPPELAEAERACRRSLELNPIYAEAYYHLTRVLVQQGRLAEAQSAIDHLAELSAGSNFVPSGQFWIDLAAGRPRAALDVLAKAGTFPRTGMGRAQASMALIRAGDADGAFAALDEALAKGFRDVAQLQGSEYFAPHRKDPRFAALLAKHGLAPAPPAPGAAAPATAPLRER